jgi:hypothetical protein
LPVPVAPEVTVSHGALVDVVHAQPTGVVTWMLPLPPEASTDCDGGDSSTLHDTPAWLTGVPKPFTVIRPCRGEAAGFAAT